MPILHQEPATYPPALWSEVDPLDEMEGGPVLQNTGDELDSCRNWWAIYTRSRQEKTLARKLYARQVPFFLPLIRQERLYRGRKMKSYVPLFSGYLFMCGDEDERVAALTTNCISRMLSVDDQPRLLRDLINIHQLIETGVLLTLEQRLQAGQSVRVKSGAFAGLEGTVIERRGKSRLLIAVDYIQQGVSMALDDFMVEPI